MCELAKAISKLSKRTVTAAAAAVLLAGALAGCGGGGSANGGAGSTAQGAGSDPQAAGKTVELRFSWWGAQERHDRTLKMIEKFEELHPNIKIEPEYSAFGAYQEKLATQIAGSNAPDIMSMSLIYIQGYAQRGVLKDMTPYVGKTLNTDGLNQELLANMGTINGELVGLPLSQSASVLFYNSEMLKQAGAEAPKPDMTYDEYFELMRDLKGKLGEGKYGTNDMAGLFEAFMYYLFSKGDVLYKDGQLAYKDENLKEWLEMWDRARKEGIVPPASETASYQLATYDPAKEPILKGTVAFEGPLFVPYYTAMEGMLKDKLEMTTIPRASGSTGTASVLLPGIFLCINENTKHPEEAALFADFMINSTEAADILELERGLPDNRKMVEYLKPKFTEVDNKMLDMLTYIGDHNPGWYDGGPKGSGEVSQLFEQIVQKQQFGKATVDEAVAEFRKEADKVLSKNG